MKICRGFFGLIFLLIAVTGCAVSDPVYRHYELSCEPNSPRAACENSNNNISICMREEALIKKCASFVDMEARRLISATENFGAAKANNSSQLKANDFGKVLVGVRDGRYIYLESSSRESFLMSTRVLAELHEQQISSYIWSRDDYFNKINNRFFDAALERKKVLKVLEDIRNMSERFEKGKKLGAFFVRDVNVRTISFNDSVAEVIAKSNPNDPNLIRAAEIVIKRQSLVDSYSRKIVDMDIGKVLSDMQSMIDSLNQYSLSSFEADEANFLEAQRVAAENQRLGNQRKALEDSRKKIERVREGKKSIACQLNPDLC